MSQEQDKPSATGRLSDTDSGTPSPLESETPVATPPIAALSLHDVTALLMQLEPTDAAELTRIRDVLQQHRGRVAAAEPASTGGVQALLGEAIKKLEQILQGKTSDPQGALTEVGWLMEGALEPEADPGQEVAPPESAPPQPSAQAVPLTLLPADGDSELLGDFITESREYIEKAEAALLTLETNPDDMESVNTVFRAFHTIKGTSAFLGLSVIAELAHQAESLLSRMRDRVIRCTGGYADLALRSVDMLKECIQALQDALHGTPEQLPAGLADLQQVLRHPEAAGVSEQGGPIAGPRLGDILVAQGKVSREDVEAAATVPPRLGDLLVAEGAATREAVEAAAAHDTKPLGLALAQSGGAALTEVAKALRTQRQMVAHDAAAESSVRVRTDRLDRLIDMVGELVIAHSMVVQDELVVRGSQHDFLKKVTHVGKIVRELQDLSMSMRMVPFKATFQKLMRVVRDVAQKSRKDVHLITDGEDAEIDRNMVDVIGDPLVHMVRNAVDHGIEPPDVRVQHGKPRTGTVRLAAYHTGGNVVIELQDDGRGLDRQRIVEKALAKGLIASDQGLSDSDVFNLIFEPGFSTAEQVTDVSGRGVGMDVVKRSIETLKGRMEITSEPGKGTTFGIYLPLTLAITDGMLVRVGSERYIIPTIDISRSFQPTAAALSTVTRRGELVMLRGELLPLFRLHRLFEIPNAEEDPTRGLLVVVSGGEQPYALLVDELMGQQQVVVKSLGAGIGEVPGIAGAAILGDGRVGLILDPTGLMTLARQAPPPSERGQKPLSAA